MPSWVHAGLVFYEKWHLPTSLLANITLGCISLFHVAPSHDAAVIGDSMIALTAFSLGSLLSLTRFRNLSIFVKVSALLITMARHYVHSHPEFRDKLSHEMQADLAKLYHQNVKPHEQLKYGNETGAEG